MCGDGLWDTLKNRLERVLPTFNFDFSSGKFFFRFNMFKLSFSTCPSNLQRNNNPFSQFSACVFSCSFASCCCKREKQAAITRRRGKGVPRSPNRVTRFLKKKERKKTASKKVFFSNPVYTLQIFYHHNPLHLLLSTLHFYFSFLFCLSRPRG